MAKSPENKRSESSIFKDLPYRVTHDGWRVYDANDYLNALGEKADGVLRKARREIKIAENGIALKVGGKLRYFKGKLG